MPPLARAIVVVPASGSGGSSISAKTLSAAVIPRWITLDTFDSVLSCVSRCSNAKMYVMKSPAP